MRGSALSVLGCRLNELKHLVFCQAACCRIEEFVKQGFTFVCVSVKDDTVFGEEQNALYEVSVDSNDIVLLEFLTVRWSMTF